MFHELGLAGWTPQAAAVVLGAVLGLAFGLLAERSRFCLRRSLAGEPGERGPALGVWAAALAIAIAGTTAIAGAGLVDLASHRLLSARLPAVAIVAGGLMFGAGMVLARGCASRLTVLAGTGNLRAVATLVVFAVLAHATLKGALAPGRAWIGGLVIDTGKVTSLAAVPGGAPLWAAIIVAALLVAAVTSRAGWRDLAMGAGIGALVPLGWLGTGFVLHDEFAPIPLETLAFTSAASEGLFWWVAGTAVAPTFGVGLLAGAIAGSFLSALAARRLAPTGFTAETGTGRYLAGGALMGVGGVLAGGCTVGAGLAGISMLSLAALLALGSIIAGGVAARVLLDRPARRPALMTAV
ncbi:MAG: YeeE/YedE family protein [Hyphomicrobiaceae bacterium]|nr:YeeE/YedE family protein [Hyphomicrobiaceae bacterium]